MSNANALLRLGSIGFGKANRMHVYLGWSRAEALTDFILRHAASLEVAASAFELPDVEFLPRDQAYPDRFVLTGAA